MLVQNYLYSQSLVNTLSIGQLTVKMVLGLMSQQRVFGGETNNMHFFDIRVFNPFALSYVNTPLAQCYRRYRLEKKRAYDQRVREIEHGSFLPLVISTGGGMGTTAMVVYRQ